MNKSEFDIWFSMNYNRLVNELSIKYPKCKRTITHDLNEIYIKVHDKSEEIKDIESYIYSYIYISFIGLRSLLLVI